MGLAVHPLAEALCRQLMACYRQLGLVTDGLAAYQSLRRRLHAEMAAEPSPSTQQLARLLTCPPA